MRGAILVVDDERAILKLFQEVLEALPVEVVAATDVAEALAAARARPFDLVVTDWCVGSDSGLRLLEELRCRENRPAVVVMSGAWSDAARGRAAALGAAAVWDKPIDLATLREEVEKWL